MLPLAPAAGAGGIGFPAWVLNFLRKRRLKKFVDEFPNAIDIINRGVKAGLPLGDCLRVIATESAEPVRGEFRQIVEAQAMGFTTSEAVDRIVERVPIAEASFFSIVIAIQCILTFVIRHKKGERKDSNFRGATRWLGFAILV